MRKIWKYLSINKNKDIRNILIGYMSFYCYKKRKISIYVEIDERCTILLDEVSDGWQIYLRD